MTDAQPEAHGAEPEHQEEEPAREGFLPAETPVTHTKKLGFTDGSLTFVFIATLSLVHEGPRLYRELAELWPLLSAPEDYAEEAAEHTRLIRDASEGEARDVLELGSGGGNTASQPMAHFPAHARRPLTTDARGEPTPEPRVRTRRGRHAFGAAGADVRRRLRARRDRPHDDRGRPPRGVREGVRALQTRRSHIVRPLPCPRDVRAMGAPGRSRWTRPGSALPRLDLGSRPEGHDDPD